MILRKASGIALLLVTFTAQANHSCAGTVEEVAVAYQGHVHAYIDTIGRGNTICSVENSKNGIGTETCKAMLSTLLTAKTTKTPVKLFFRNDTTNCQKGDWKDFTSTEYGFYFLQLMKE